MIADAIDAIEEFAAEELRRIIRRGHVRNLPAESDAVMAVLEQTNLLELKATPKSLRPRLIALFGAVLDEELSNQNRVIRETQAALEHVYIAQDVLLNQLHPWRIALQEAEQGERTITEEAG